MNTTISDMKRRANICHRKLCSRFIFVYGAICTYTRRIQSIYCVKHYIHEIGNKSLNLLNLLKKD